MSFRERILAQPARLRALAADLGRADHPLRSAVCRRLLEKPRLVLTGMGASLFAAYPAYLRLAAAGRSVALWETSELVHFAPGAIDADTLVVAVSQSGETAEIRALLEQLPPSQPLLGITNFGDSTLAGRAQVTVNLSAERDHYASTQTYVNSVAQLLAVARAVAGEPLEPFLAVVGAAAGALEVALQESFARSEPHVDPGDRLVFLARGPSLAAAQYGALLFQEVAARGATALSAAAFRHGPIETAGPPLQSVVLLPWGPTAALVENLAADLERFGGRVIRIADARHGRGDFRHPAVDEELIPVVNIAPIQAMACRAALALGREPGVFRQCQSVTRNE